MHAIPGESVPSLWLPEPLAAEGKGSLHPARVHQASGCLSHSLQREKARRTRGECAQTSDGRSRSLWREKVRHTWGEAAKTSGCLSRSPQRAMLGLAWENAR